MKNTNNFVLQHEQVRYGSGMCSVHYKNINMKESAKIIQQLFGNEKYHGPSTGWSIKKRIVDVVWRWLLKWILIIKPTIHNCLLFIWSQFNKMSLCSLFWLLCVVVHYGQCQWTEIISGTLSMPGHVYQI